MQGKSTFFVQLTVLFLNRLRVCVLARACTHPRGKKPTPTCLVTSIAKETILSLRPWCAANACEEVRSQIQYKVKEALSQEKSEAPKIIQ